VPDLRRRAGPVLPGRKVSQTEETADVKDELKTCGRCHDPKTLSAFRIVTAHGSTYRHGWCIECSRKYWRGRPKKKKTVDLGEVGAVEAAFMTAGAIAEDCAAGSL
jgi:hypothetical protein